MFITKTQVSPSADINKQVPTKVASAEVIKQTPKKAVKKKPQPKKKRPVKVEKPIQVEKREETPVAPKPEVVEGCGDNSYASYIYTHESGCNLQAQNAGGCLGIGQACPGSKLLAVCPNLDYECENEFFTQYAVSRYGSWEGAYNAWLSQGWW